MGVASPTVASSGQTVLAVWFQPPFTPNLGSTPPYPTGMVIVGTRIDADGRVVDPGGVSIAALRTSPPSPLFVGSDGSGFIVVWGEASGALRAVRVTDALVIRDTTPLTIAASGALAGSGGNDVGVAGIDGEYVVVWSGAEGTSYALVEATGAVSSPVQLDASTGHASPRVASNGAGYAVAWSTASGLLGARISKAGVLVGTVGFGITNGSVQSPDLASNGSDFFAVWRDDRNAGDNGDIYGARFSAAGVVLDAAGMPIATGFPAQARPSVGSNGTDYLVAWEDRGADTTGTTYPDVKGARVSAEGVVVSTRPFHAFAFQGMPHVTGLRSEFFVEYQSGATLGTRVSDAGLLLDAPPLDIALGRDDETDSRISSNGSTYLVLENRKGSLTTLSDSADVLSRASTQYPSASCIASNGTDYLAAWSEYPQSSETPPSLKVARVFANGAPDTTTGTTVVSGTGSAFLDLAIAGTAAGYLAVWCNRVANGSEFRGILLGSSGKPLGDGDFVIATTLATCDGIATGTDGKDFLVAFNDDGDAQPRRLRAVRVRADATVLDQTPLTIASGDALSAGSVSISFASGEYLIVWSAYATTESTTTGYALRAARMRRDGSVVDGKAFSLTTPVPPASSPWVASDGTDHVVIWEGSTSASGHGAYGVRIPGGTSRAEPFTLSVQPGHPDGEIQDSRPSSVVIAARAPGEFVAVYYKFVPETRSFQRAARTVRSSAPVLDGGAPDVAVPDSGGASRDAAIDRDAGGKTGGAGGATASGGDRTATPSNGGRPQDGGPPTADAGLSSQGKGAQGCACATVTHGRWPSPTSILVGITLTASLLRRRLRPARLAVRHVGRRAVPPSPDPGA